MSDAATEAIARAKICLEETRDKETERAFAVIEKIHESSDHRGEQIMRYVNAAKEFFLEMKSEAGK